MSLSSLKQLVAVAQVLRDSGRDAIGQDPMVVLSIESVLVGHKWAKLGPQMGHNAKRQPEGWRLLAAQAACILVAGGRSARWITGATIVAGAYAGRRIPFRII